MATITRNIRSRQLFYDIQSKGFVQVSAKQNTTNTFVTFKLGLQQNGYFMLDRNIIFIYYIWKEHLILK